MTAEAGCRAALYLRLSRDDTGRAGESESIANQRRLLHDYALRQGWPVVAEYADDGVSGTTFDRPQFQKMLCEIPQRGINLILIKDDCVIIEPTQKDLENQGFVAGSICF